MPKVAKQLSDRAVAAIKAEGRHAVGGVPGLHLRVSAGHRGWVLRVQVGDQRRDIGMGAYPTVGLSEAREKAREIHDGLREGKDPVAPRKQQRMALAAQAAAERTFHWCAQEFIRAKASEWSNPKHRKQWENTLETYVYPSIGDVLVRHVGISHVTAIIEPHWTTKNETMNRVRNRIELILDWATVRKYRTGDNPARWKGNLDKLLAVRSKVAPVVGHRALDAGDLYGFMEILRGIDGMGARCLEFVILTACRSGEARLATWEEIDIDGKTWNIPGDRMKSGRPHRIPLSSAVIALLAALPRFKDRQGNDIDLVFPGQ
ncbi:MAG: integrase arm-type DNA-binding domain-containing protein, partial [Burkholderiaceae bacterium]|nr:integrase arm-type DNA-binding domain-containing protein [Burkholderiaceae bacterium]